MDRFVNRRALVTGGASGIGRATVLRLLREGATAVAVDVDAAGLGRTVELAGAEDAAERLRTRELDVADEEMVAEVVRSAVGDLGGLDVLVNAAGILRAAHTHECSLQVWNEVLRTNLTGTFLVTRTALPALLESGRGVVVSIPPGATATARSPRPLRPVIGGRELGAPEMVPGVVAMLASDDGAFITGTEVRIDGGACA